MGNKPPPLPSNELLGPLPQIADTPVQVVPPLVLEPSLPAICTSLNQTMGLLFSWSVFLEALERDGRGNRPALVVLRGTEVVLTLITEHADIEKGPRIAA